MGTLVSAVCYGGDVACFQSTLRPYKRYYISNAYVKPVRVGYEVSDYEYSWTLYNTTSVHPMDEDIPPPIPYDFQFKEFSEMFRYADREAPINIKALIVQASDEKKVGVDLYGQPLIAQDFVVVDTKKTPMVMRLWKEKIKEYGEILSKDLPNAVMFVGVNMKVTTFNGLSFSSRLNIVLLKEPIIPEGPALKKWYVSNKKDVDELLSRMSYKDTSILLRKPTAADVMPISNATATLETIKTAWIAGKLKLIPVQDRFWYMACKNCHRALKLGHEIGMPCSSCDEPDPISVSDASGTAYAEQLIPFSAMQLKEAEEEGRLVATDLESALENKHVVCYIKYFDKLIRGAVTRKYPLVKIYPYKDVFPIEEPVAREAESLAVMADNETVDLTKDNEDDVQFFTPSTKVLIEEISASSQDAAVDDAGQVGLQASSLFW